MPATVVDAAGCDVAGLGAADFDARERAQADLLALGEKASGQLRRSLTTVTDAEALELSTPANEHGHAMHLVLTGEAMAYTETVPPNTADYMRTSPVAESLWTWLAAPSRCDATMDTACLCDLDGDCVLDFVDNNNDEKSSYNQRYSVNKFVSIFETDTQPLLSLTFT